MVVVAVLDVLSSPPAYYSWHDDFAGYSFDRPSSAAMYTGAPLSALCTVVVQKPQRPNPYMCLTAVQGTVGGRRFFIHKYPPGRTLTGSYIQILFSFFFVWTSLHLYFHRPWQRNKIMFLCRSQTFAAFSAIQIILTDSCLFCKYFMIWQYHFQLQYDNNGNSLQVQLWLCPLGQYYISDKSLLDKSEQFNLSFARGQ